MNLPCEQCIVFVMCKYKVRKKYGTLVDLECKAVINYIENNNGDWREYIERLNHILINFGLDAVPQPLKHDK